jgi:protocatechuate 3,4-dioxygenase beta subunit
LREIERLMNARTPPPVYDAARRRVLQALAAAPAAFPVACAGGLAHAAPAAGSEFAAATIGLIATNVCSVTPATTEGPYYLDPKLVRSDIRERKPGVALQLRIQVVTADCRPIVGARVDVWHCDAQGNYSGFASQGSDHVSDTRREIFLRGTQKTGAQGIVSFDTIYPGWYHGRTPHIHYKVFLDRKTVLTSQIFFPDALSQYLFDHATAYRRDEPRDMVNVADDIAAQAGEGAYCAIREQKDRYIAALVVGVDPTAEWAERGQGMRGPPPPGPPGSGSRPGPGGPPPPPGVDLAKVKLFPGE